MSRRKDERNRKCHQCGYHFTPDAFQDGNVCEYCIDMADRDLAVVASLLILTLGALVTLGALL